MSKPVNIILALVLALCISGALLVANPGTGAAQDVEPEASVTLDLTSDKLQYLRGDTITYTATIENPHPTASMVVEFVQLTYPDASTEVLLAFADPDIILATSDGNPLTGPDSYSWTRTWVVPVDYQCGTIVAQVDASGYQDLPDVTDTFDASVTRTVTVICPDIEVIKTADPEVSKATDVVVYTIQVLNTGDTALENITVVDSLMGDLSGSYADTLGVAGSESHNFTRDILDADPNPVVNEVVVHADPAGPLTNDITDSDSASVKRRPMVPSLSQWGIIAMVVVFGGLLVWTVRRRWASRTS
jgi:uncharacterized repeat protein (TIGR01451 family)